jgi:hypothetical protein
MASLSHMVDNFLNYCHIILYILIASNFFQKSFHLKGDVKMKTLRTQKSKNLFFFPESFIARKRSADG